MHQLLGTVLLVVQASILIPLITHTVKSKTTKGMSLTGETIWTAGGFGWMIYAIWGGFPTVIISGFLAMAGSGVLAVLIWRDSNTETKRAATLVTIASTIVGVASTLLYGIEGLSVALAVFGVVQFIPQTFTSMRAILGKTATSGVSITATALRAEYAGGWALYAAGWAVWGVIAPEVQYPLLVWGMAGVVAFATQIVAAHLGRVRSWA